MTQETVEDLKAEIDRLRRALWVLVDSLPAHGLVGGLSSLTRMIDALNGCDETEEPPND